MDKEMVWVFNNFNKAMFIKENGEKTKRMDKENIHSKNLVIFFKEFFQMMNLFKEDGI
jgi:hypothetical protein